MPSYFVHEKNIQNTIRKRISIHQRITKRFVNSRRNNCDNSGIKIIIRRLFSSRRDNGLSVSLALDTK